MKTAVAAFEPPRRSSTDFVPFVSPANPDMDRLLGLLEVGTTAQVQSHWGYNVSAEQADWMRTLFGLNLGEAA